MNAEGLGVTLVAGLLGGSVFAPLKLLRSWKFEKSWALYSVCAYLIMPWLVAMATIPHLFNIYSRVSSRTAIICAACGLGWGIAVVLVGLSVKLVGLSLATAIIYGSSIAVGSLGPVLISSPGRLFTNQGVLLILADLGIILGVLLCIYAGSKRGAPRQLEGNIVQPASSHRDFIRGLVASIFAAILSSLFNIALAYGGEFNRLSVLAGAGPLNATNALWAFTVSFGYIPNVLVTIVTFTRNGLWSDLSRGPISHWIGPPIMGVAWIGGTVLYGAGAELLGNLGPVIGWPVYMSMAITTGVFWGWITGEWKHAPQSALRLLTAGLLFQLVCIAALGAVA